jgi:hypothetical protein
MFASHRSRIAGAMAGALLACSAPGLAAAAPMSVAGQSVVSPPAPVVDVRYRGRVRHRHHYVRRYHHHGIGPGAVLGLFGAALGAAIASDRYDYYPYPYYYSYGYPYYGYAYGYPAYRHRWVYRPRYRYYAPRYRGFARRGFVHRGFVGHRFGGFRGGAHFAGRRGRH